MDTATFFVNEKHSSLFEQRGYTSLASEMANFNLKLKQLSESNTLYYYAYDKVFYKVKQSYLQILDPELLFANEKHSSLFGQ